MHIIGLIAEYNPFHNGHLYQINKIKEKYPDSIIIAVVSSSFTQRGDISIIDKWTKTKIALDNNIDVVVELPFVYATQSSDIFAKGAIEILNHLNIDILVFGTESTKLDQISIVADLELYNPEYNNLVKQYLKEGINYPTATNKAILALNGKKISTPNDLLALSYIKELKKQNLHITPVNIVRTNNYHSLSSEGNISSATAIRNKNLKNEKIDNLIPYNPNKIKKISMNNYYLYLKYKILSEGIEIKKYNTLEEGIENKITKEIINANNYKELITKIKTKRYTYNKISRMLLHILTNFTKEEAQNIKIDYIRILGFNKNGQKYLNKIKKEVKLPLLTGYQKNVSKILDIELRVSKIYSLSNESNLIKKEYDKKPIIKM